MPLQDEMWQTAFAQLLAHHEAGLTAANDQCLDIFDWHAGIPFGCGQTHAWAMDLHKLRGASFGNPISANSVDPAGHEAFDRSSLRV
jgi:hypothetical protein